MESNGHPESMSTISPGSDQIHCLTCSPYLESAGFLAFATDISVCVLTRQLKNNVEEDLMMLENKNPWPPKFDPPIIFNHGGTRITSLSWAPDSRSPTPEDPYNWKISFCATDGTRIWYYNKQSSDLNEQPQVKLIANAHTVGINGSTFWSNESRLLLATVSDDRYCRIWDILKGEEIESIQLQTAGWSVKWHSENNQIMIAEESGKVKIVDLSQSSFNVVATLHTNTPGFLDVDWIPRLDPLVFGGVCGSHFFLWESESIPSYSTLKHPISHSTPTSFRFCPSQHGLFATSSKTSNVVYIWTRLKLDRPVTHSFQSKISAISWLGNEAILVLASDSKLHFWSIGV